MKRLKIINKGRFITVITILILLTGCSLKANKTYETEKYTVVAGDTLWSIGLKYCDNQTDIREWIYNVEKLNNCTANIYVGQMLEVIK